jgi:hypothetical protein
MKKTLVVGCSMIETLSPHPSSPALAPLSFEHVTPNNYYKFCGNPGAGNTVIAQVTLHEIATHKYDEVIVLWSGINRIDLAVGKALLPTIPMSILRCIRKINDTIWISSGGAGSADRTDYPKEIRQAFSLLYKDYFGGKKNKHLTEITLSNILLLQNVLEIKNIPYHMSFMYDAFVPSDEDFDFTLGQLDSSSHLYQMVTWEKFKTLLIPLYNWAKDQNCFTEDQFHPTGKAIKEWLSVNFNLDLQDLTIHDQCCKITAWT